MEIKNNRLHEGKGTFLIDIGSELNLLKESCIDGNCDVIDQIYLIYLVSDKGH